MHFEYTADDLSAPVNLPCAGRMLIRARRAGNQLRLRHQTLGSPLGFKQARLPIVCGEDCGTAERLLGEVERRLTIIPRGFPKPDTTVLAMIARFSKWQFPDVDSLHALGTDAVSRKILKGGVLYPCQAIFLGQTMPLAPPAAVFSKYTESPRGQDKTPPFVAVERSGIMVNEKMTSAERATLIGLMQVTQRTEESARLRYLKGAEVTDVLSKGVHGYKKVVVMETPANTQAESKKSPERVRGDARRQQRFGAAGNVAG